MDRPTTRGPQAVRTVSPKRTRTAKGHLLVAYTCTVLNQQHIRSSFTEEAVH